MYTCWECLESFQSEKVLFQHLDKHFNETVKEESYFPDIVKTEESDAPGLGLNLRDSYNIMSTSYEKDDNSDTLSQVTAPDSWSSQSMTKSENSMKAEPINSVPTQPSTGAFRCEYCDEEFQMKANLVQHVY
eukprot:362023_1